MRNTLKVRRAERNWNQRDAALRLGVGRDRYLRIELGYAEPTPAEIKRLAKAFRTDPAVLFPVLAAAIPDQGPAQTEDVA